MPACGQLLDAARAAGEVHADITAVELMRGVGDLCIGAQDPAGHDPRRLVGLLVAGLGAEV